MVGVKWGFGEVLEGTWLGVWLSAVARAQTGKWSHSTNLRTPPLLNLLPRHPLGTPLGKLLALGDETLMNGVGEHCAAVPAELVAEMGADC